MFEKFIATIIGKRIESKLNLYEGDVMPTKNWYQSKTVWSAIIGAILGAVQPVSAALGHPIVIPSWIFEVLGSLGLYALRTGAAPIA